MSRFSVTLVVIVVLGTVGLALMWMPGTLTATANTADKNALKETLIALEKQSWEAWQKRDAKFFQQFLTEDHVEVGFGGLTNKAAVVAGVGSPNCVVKSYSVEKFQVTAFDAKTAVLNYYAQQDTTCNGVAVPSPAWVSSLYVKRNGRWVNALYQQTQAIRRPQ